MGGTSGTMRGITPLSSIPNPVTIGPVIGGAVGAAVGTSADAAISTTKEVVTKGVFKLGFLWFGFALILLGLIIIAFKNDTVRSGVKSATKAAALA